jgi:hypothetical protein
MRKNSWIPIVIVPLVIIAAFVIARMNYYGPSSGLAYSPPDRPLSDVPVDIAARSERLEAVDNPTVSQGVVVIDYTHNNAFFIEELNTLLAKIVARGYSYEVLLKADDEENDLAAKLRYAKALVLPVPRAEYTPQEILEIESFVERGGRLFIISDPTRTVVVEALNSIAGSFGIIFANDYLYSLTNNDNNYRNVVFTNFEDSPITRGLSDGQRVILYAGNSINAPGNEIILGDATTASSTSEGGRTKAAAALTTNGQVLAIGDLTFFSEPYSTAENNGTLINNVADFLTGAQPSFKLTDFPFFFNKTIDIVFNDPLVFNSQFAEATKLKEFLEAQEHIVNFTDKIGPENDVIFIGRLDNTKPVDRLLKAASIAILEPKLDEEPADDEDETEVIEAEVDTEATTEPEATAEPAPAPPSTINGDGQEETLTELAPTSAPKPAAKKGKDEERFIEGRIQIAGVGDLERGGSTLFYLNQEDNRNILLILSDTAETNRDAFDILLKNKLLECQAAPQIAVCQTDDPNDDLPPSLRSNRINKILVVSDDDGRKRGDAQTGVLEFTDAFSQTAYKVDTWGTTDKGSPNLDKLLEYDAIIWSTGDYWDDSIGQADAELLAEYRKVGGNLILSGASIAFDWDHTDFLATVPHADYLTFSSQTDLAVAAADHPIAEDFDETTPITFLATPSGEALDIDVVNYTADSRVIFRRGAASEHKDAPAVIAYEDDRVKVAYYAFPLYLLPAPERTLLVNNTVDWFTQKILDLPAAKDYEPFELEDGGESDTSTEGEAGEGDESSGDTGDEGSGGNGDGN